MEPISNVSHLVEVLRKQIAESQNAKLTTSSKATGPAKSAAAPTRTAIGELQKKTREKIGRLVPSDPRIQQKSIRIFLESVLAWQFGEDLIGDPKFYSLIDDVQNAMEADPNIQQQLADLVKKLR